ncbi:MAG: HSP20 family protein [Candidatus Latescibacterota bacterium]|jgi:HSP20 family protein
MALIRWQPRQTFSVNSEIDKLVNQFWNEPLRYKGQATFPKVDIAENDQAFVLQAELPGMKREEINVSLEDGVLTVAGERKSEDEKEGKNYVHRERTYGSFKRSFRLGKEVQAATISAAYTEGVLTVTLPKAEEVKPRQIEVAVS